jgi:hypothetical protein
LVDEHVCALISKEVDLKEYFASKLPNLYVEHTEYPTLHSDDTKRICTINHESPTRILNYYNETIGSNFKEGNESDVGHTIEYFFVNLPETLTKNKTEIMRVLK